VRCDPATAQANVGEEVTIDLYIEDVEDLYAVDLETDFDVGFLQVIDADLGTEDIQLEPVNGWFWSDWIWFNEASNDTGHTHYLATEMRTIHPDPADGSGPIARITFTGLEGGTTVMTWSRADLTTPEGVAIPNVTQDCTVVLLIPTGVSLAQFFARPMDGAINVEWETTTDVNILGFNLYRAQDRLGEPLLLNEALIPVQELGSSLGAQYQYPDRSALPGLLYHYWLDFVRVDGSTSRHGPVSAILDPFRLYLPIAISGFPQR
jgi:hypothetical protein